jgi:Flp pilus assembly protein TadD
MRLKIALTTTLTLCGVLLFSASGLRPQGVAGRASTHPARYTNAPGGLDLTDPLPSVQPPPAAQPYGTPPTKTVSVRELLVPPKAVKEFQRSQQALRSGDFQSAAGHLEKAVQIAPSFLEAHNNLGASYIGLHEYEKAGAQFQKAIDLDSNLAEPYHNLALALFLLRRFPEAENAARHGLDLDPKRSSVRYILGRILAAEGNRNSEAAEILRNATAEYPEARLPLAQVLLEQGAVDDAAAELRAYLKGPDPAKKQLVACWLAQMTQESGSRACLLAKQKP